MSSAIVLLADGFEDVEAVTIVDILRRAGVSVVVAGVVPGIVTGARGTRVLTEIDLKSAEVPSHDAVVLPGGTKGAEALAASSEVKAVVSAHHKAGKIVAAICAAPAVVLAPMGLLDGKRATCFPGMESLFPASAVYSEEPVVVDGALITSRALGTALAFALVLVDKLAGPEKAKSVRRAVLA